MLGAMARRTGPSREDLGAALMAWYVRALTRHPEGLVSQAQAARMVGLSRMAVSRLLAGGHMRAVYFPRPPDIAGVAVGRDDPGWLEVAGWLGVDPAAHVAGWPRACYVSFADVIKLWQVGRARASCTRPWERLLAELGATAPPSAEAVPEAEQARPPDELEPWML